MLNSVRFWKHNAPSLNSMANLGKPNWLARHTVHRVAPLGREGDLNTKWTWFLENGALFLRFKGQEPPGACAPARKRGSGAY